MILSKLNDYIEKISIFVITILFVVFIIAVFSQVFARNVLTKNIIWMQDISLFAFIWSVFVGGAICFRRRSHYIIELFPGKEPINSILDLFADSMVFILIYIFIFAGYEFAIMGFSRTTQMGIKLVYFTSVFPVAGVLMTLFGIELIIEDIKKLLSYLRGEDIAT